MISLPSQKSEKSLSDDSGLPHPGSHFDGRAPLELAGGRVYDLLEVRCFDHFPGFEREYVVEMEAQERTTQSSTWLRVIIAWEEVYGHSALPSEAMLLLLARRVATRYFIENRFNPRFSALNRAVMLRFPF